MRPQSEETINKEYIYSFKPKNIYKRKHQISNHPKSPKKKEKNKKLIILLIILLLLLIFLIIFLIVFFLLKKKKIYKEEEKLLNCAPGYELVNEKCIRYSFKATYKTEIDNENITLINSLPTDIIEMTVDGKKEKPSKNFVFPNKGNHTIYFLLNIDNCKSISFMFFYIFEITSIIFTSNFNTINIEDMNSLFSGCESLTSIDISTFNTQNVKSMDGMFHSCTSLVSIDLSNLNMENVEITYKMFYCCYSLVYINFSNTKTLKLKDMTAMFDACYSLTSIDLSSFKTKNVTSPGAMFYDCNNLTYIDISSFDFECNYECGMFNELPDYGVIKLKNNFTNNLGCSIPEGWNKIIIN